MDAVSLLIWTAVCAEHVQTKETLTRELGKKDKKQTNNENTHTNRGT